MRISTVGIAACVVFVAAAAYLTTFAWSAAAGPWTYICDTIDEPAELGAKGAGNCRAENGAPESGPITQKFQLRQHNAAPKPDKVAVCEGESQNAYGAASLPGKVDGFGCYIYESPAAG